MAHVKSSGEIERALRALPAFALAQSAIAEEVCKVARDLAAPSSKSGRYLEGIGSTHRGDKWVARASAEHSAPIEGGTGLYGRKHRMIRAAAGKKFRITLPDGSIISITKQRGTRPKHIMDHAAEIVAARSSGLSYRRHRWRRVAD